MRRIKKSTLKNVWSLVLNRYSYSSALELTKGCYQEDLINGRHALSGSTLKGEAKNWSARYAASRKALLNRLSRANVAHCEGIGPHNRRVLVIGAWSVDVIDG